jgi:hypothetical protein
MMATATSRSAASQDELFCISSPTCKRYRTVNCTIIPLLHFNPIGDQDADANRTCSSELAAKIEGRPTNIVSLLASPRFAFDLMRMRASSPRKPAKKVREDVHVSMSFIGRVGALLPNCHQ